MIALARSSSGKQTYECLRCGHQETRKIEK
jgi:hypothetical protein